VLIILALVGPSRRYQFAAVAGALIIASALYVKLVINPHTQVSLENNWYPNNPGWYYRVLKSCVQYTYGEAGLIAVGLCAGVGCLKWASCRTPRGDGKPFWQPSLVSLEAIWALLIGVPILVLIGAAVSSTLLAPNFFDRNFLVLSPFFWALSARLFDIATVDAARPVRRALNFALAAIVLSMSSIVTLRLPSEDAPPLYEPFRESANWIQTMPLCRGRTVLAITTDRKAWYKSGYAEAIYGSAYGRYLDGFAQPKLVFMEDILASGFPMDLRADLQQRVDGGGCPVLAWSVHNMRDETMAKVKASLLQSTDRVGSDADVEIKSFKDGDVGYILYRTAGSHQ
jgi:hypothetical protein